MKIYITFGQCHVHHVNGKTFDKDCVAVIHGFSREACSLIRRAYFGQKYCFEYPENEFHKIEMEFFPRGLVEVNPEKVT